MNPPEKRELSTIQMYGRINVFNDVTVPRRHSSHLLFNYDRNVELCTISMASPAKILKDPTQIWLGSFFFFLKKGFFKWWLKICWISAHLLQKKKMSKVLVILLSFGGFFKHFQWRFNENRQSFELSFGRFRFLWFWWDFRRFSTQILWKPSEFSTLAQKISSPFWDILKSGRDPLWASSSSICIRSPRSTWLSRPTRGNATTRWVKQPEI